jgi:hypothetical protein
VLYVYTENRSLWLSINRGILTLIPSRATYASLLQMPLSTLRLTAINAHRIDKRWTKIHPEFSNSRYVSCHRLTKHVRLLPGGETFLGVLENGTLYIRKLDNAYEAVVLPLSDGYFHVALEYFSSSSYSSSDIAIVHNSSWNIE